VRCRERRKLVSARERKREVTPAGACPQPARKRQTLATPKVSAIPRANGSSAASAVQRPLPVSL